MKLSAAEYRHVNFFATRADLEPGILRIEAESEIKYVRPGAYCTCEVEGYTSALLIPELGVATREIFDVTDGYLVLPRNEPINVCQFKNSDSGTVRYSVRTYTNLGGFLFHFGGLFDAKKLIGGGCILDQAARSPEVLAMRRKYAEYITEGFFEIRDQNRVLWQVGPEAFQMLADGFTLQTNFQYPVKLTLDNIPKRLRNSMLR